MQLSSLGKDTYLNNKSKIESQQNLRKCHLMGKILPKSCIQDNSYFYVGDAQSTITFIEWLTSVTEQINQTLCSKQSECIETLNFCVHLVSSDVRNLTQIFQFYVL